MAVGKAGELAERDRLKIWIGDELVAEQGMQSVNYDESRASAHLESRYLYQGRRWNRQWQLPSGHVI